MLKNQEYKEDKNVLAEAENLFKNAIKKYEYIDYQGAFEDITEAHRLYLETNNMGMVASCLSFIGLLKYLKDSRNYLNSLMILEDAKFISHNCKCIYAVGINKYAFSQILMKENNYKEALLYLTRADILLEEYPYIQVRIFEALAYINLELKNYERSFYFINKAIKLAEKKEYINCLNRIKIIASSLQNQNDLILTTSASHVQHDLDSTDDNADHNPMIAMLKIARTISAAFDLDSLLKTIAEQTKLALNADRCTVFLIDKEKEELWSRVALGLESEEIRFPLNKGLAGHVALTGETIHIKNAYTDSRFNKDIDIQTGYKTKNILCMPIRNIKYEIIGVFQVLNKQDGEFTDYDEDLLLMIGSSAGIALENNILFKSQEKMLQEQKLLFSSFIDTLAASIDARDKITSGHSSRVKMYAEIISKELTLDEKTIQTISQAALLHDIGKIGIRDSVLQKEGRLTPDEYEHIKSHVTITHDILSKICASKEFEEVVEIASSHHEKFDGSGYFRHLKGDEIPFGGRILAVADVFDAITSVRHYRDKMPIKNAIAILVEGNNKHFDKVIVDAFLNISCDKIIDIFLTEYNMTLDETNRGLLCRYTMGGLFAILNKENPQKSEQDFIELFESYYINKSVTVKQV